MDPKVQLESLKKLRITLEEEREQIDKELKKAAEESAENARLRAVIAGLRNICPLPIEPQLRLETRFSRAFAMSFGAEYAEVNPYVQYSGTSFGDYKMVAAMGLCAKLGRKSDDIARTVVANLDKSDFKAVNVAGPGFVNVTLTDDYVVQLARHLHQTGAQITAAIYSETVVIDYSSPNVAKEMHVGHLRSTVIGDALARLCEAKGHKVIRQNHIGDWGTQFGMLTEMLIEQGAKDVDGSQLNAMYKAAKKRFDADEDFKERSRRRVVQLQSGDEQTIQLWKQLVDASRVYFEKIYAKMEVTLKDSDIRGESSYNGDLKGVVEYLQKQGALSESEGALVAYVDGFFSREGGKLPFIIQKADGGFGYASTDLAAIRHRSQTLGANRILYVVDARQSDHFLQVFDVAKRSGVLGTAKAEHIKFGTIMGEDKKPFKTREGDTIRLMDLLDEAVSKSEETVSKKNPSLSEEERAQIAQVVGIGAIKYFDLSSDRTKDYVFSWERMLALEGNTAPYLQYGYTRIQSIFRKAAELGIEINRETDVSDIEITDAEEHALVMKAAQFNRIVDLTLETASPHLLCTYLYELTTQFHHFYDHCPVLKHENTRKTRLVLCSIVGNTLRVGLNCLGINVVNRM